MQKILITMHHSKDKAYCVDVARKENVLWRDCCTVQRVMRRVTSGAVWKRLITMQHSKDKAYCVDVAKKEKVLLRDCCTVQRTMRRHHERCGKD